MHIQKIYPILRNLTDPIFFQDECPVVDFFAHLLGSKLSRGLLSLVLLSYREGSRLMNHNYTPPVKPTTT